jgi:raffinose/stachyose/melibiose transport system substrate-binding protein
MTMAKRAMILALTLVCLATFTATAQKTTLVYLSKWNAGEVTQKIIQAAIDEYNSTNTKNVEIEPIWAGREVNVKLMAMIQGGTPPDFYDEDPNLIENSLGKEGLAVDLLPLLKSVQAADQNKKVIDTFSKGFFDAITYRGQVNTLPIQQYLTVVFYNKTLFKKLGIAKTPDTWAEFLKVCETIKGKGIAPIVMDGGIDFYNLYWYSHLADRYEGMNALLGAIYDKTGKSWDKPGFLKAAQAIKELRDKGYFIKGFEGYQFPAGQIDWAQGKGAFLLIHTYMPIEVKDSVPDDFVFGSFPFPSVPGGKGDQFQLTSAMGGVAILKSTKDPALAFDFLKTIVSRKVQARFAQEAQNVPAVTGVPLPPIFKDIEQIMVKQTGTFKDYSSGPGSFEPEYATSVLYPLNTQLLFGKITPADFIKQLKEKSIAYWKNK